MDPAIFIRKKSVLALWLIVPVALIAGSVIISKSLLEREKAVYMQYKVLEQLVPEMIDGLSNFDQFISDYCIDSDTILSIENHQIASMNEAAENIDFTINSINFVQDPKEKVPAGITRISIRIKGYGSVRGIGAFLNNIHARDQHIYEKQIQIVPGVTEIGRFQLEAEFGKVYVQRKGPVK